MRTLIVVFIVFLGIQQLIAQDNALTEQEKKEGWKLVFNGKNLDGWTSVGKDTPPAFGWDIEDGVLTVRKQGDKQGGDIISKEQYSNFDLMVDFRITAGANSGIKYFFVKYDEGGWLGLEYQILDDENHPDGKLGRDGNRLTATLYDMLPATTETKVSPTGEWNRARIVAKGTTVTHYLNGEEVLKFDRSSALYKDTWKMSKYKDSKPMFGDVEKGHILLQDHGDVVSFRNVKIREL